METSKYIYAIASTYDGSDLDVNAYYTNDKVMKHISELLDGYYHIKPNPNDDPEEFISDYYEWVRNEEDNTCTVDIAITKMRLS